MNLGNILNGISGEPEINRTVGAFGAFVFIVSVPAFVAVQGNDFPLVAYCAAFPTGIGLVIAAISGGAALKDKFVTAAKATQAQTDAGTV